MRFNPSIITAPLLCAALLLLPVAQADSYARQQNLSRRLQEQQFDLKLRQTQRPPLILKQPEQERASQQGLQQQLGAQLDLYEQQRRELLHTPAPSEQQLQRQRDAQALDFKMHNSR